jgi:mannose-1-phosphate guanylyltransferase/phosphomannomutase
MKGLILAAGVGKRLAPFTNFLPKPMLPVLNKPVLEHNILRLKEAGITEILINLYHLQEEIVSYFGNGEKFGVNITWRIETNLSGPAGALLAFKDILTNSEDILILSGDGIHEFDIMGFIKHHKEKKSEMTVLMKEVTNAGRYGVARLDQEGKIIEFIEKPPLPVDEKAVVSCGVYCMNSKLLNLIPSHCEYDYGDIIKGLINESIDVYGYVTDDYWIDIGTPETLLKANKDALLGLINTTHINLDSSNNIIIEDNVEVVEPVLIGNNVTLMAGSKIIGPVIIGDNCTIGKNSYIEHSLLLKDTILSDYSVIIGGISWNSKKFSRSNSCNEVIEL